MYGEKRRRGKSAVTKSTLLAAIVLAVMVSLVSYGIYLTYFPGIAPTTSNSNNSTISFRNLTLLSGRESMHSFNASCGGDAKLEISMLNPTERVVHITQVTITGSNLKNPATALLSVSNSCLSISESNPALSPLSDYFLDGFLDAPLAFNAQYNYTVQFDNGQTISGSLIAQS